MAAVIPATAWGQRGAATLQPPAARGCSPKGVGLIVAEALMKLSAKIRVRLEGTTMSVSDVFGDVYWILVMIMGIGSMMCIVDHAGSEHVLDADGLAMGHMAIRLWMMLVTGRESLAVRGRVDVVRGPMGIKSMIIGPMIALVDT